MIVQKRSENMQAPRIMLTAPKSGSGKTFITCGLLEALKRRGLQVSAFKCGPDYIDPLFHQKILKTPSKNLDTYFADADTVKALFAESAKKSDISVMEGVMGYYDGLGGVEWKASTYDLACVTQTPVILVVDTKGMSRSVIPYIKGFVDYGEEKWIQGIILNRISPMLYEILKTQIEKETGIKVVGYLPECKDVKLESRHLGLVMPEEISNLQETIGKLAVTMEKTFLMEDILELAHKAPELTIMEPEITPVVNRMEKIRIGVARDEAFCFYYEDNLRYLEKMGAEILPFSPIKDASLPEADGLLFGGGYPELHAKALSSNLNMRKAIQKAADAGIPILAECGGFMYLQEYLIDMEGKEFPMACVLAGKSFYTGKLSRFGYVELTDGEGLSIKGHEFHYFDSTNNGDTYHAKKPSGRSQWDCMVQKHKVLAGFPHLYYPSNPEFVKRFLLQCVTYRKKLSKI